MVICWRHTLRWKCVHYKYSYYSLILTSFLWQAVIHKLLERYQDFRRESTPTCCGFTMEDFRRLKQDFVTLRSVVNSALQFKFKFKFVLIHFQQKAIQRYYNISVITEQMINIHNLILYTSKENYLWKWKDPLKSSTCNLWTPHSWNCGVVA